MQTNFVSIYLLTAGLFFLVLLVAFWFDGSTPKQHRLSWMIILIGALFWGVVFPLAVIERSRKLFRQNALVSRVSRGH
jgi:threonine/homoserine/homoserine lactone efflux protein